MVIASTYSMITTCRLTSGEMKKQQSMRGRCRDHVLHGHIQDIQESRQRKAVANNPISTPKPKRRCDLMYQEHKASEAKLYKYNSQGLLQFYLAAGVQGTDDAVPAFAARMQLKISVHTDCYSKVSNI